MESRRTLWTLYAINFLNAVGMWFFLPLLPIFLGRKGGSAALVGVVFAAGLVANAVVRYPAGWLAAGQYVPCAAPCRRRTRMNAVSGRGRR